jgi:cellulose synthase/poly-beta-1,6-N-acetylglucosamine synthase-like glycosyltransferase
MPLDDAAVLRLLAPPAQEYLFVPPAPGTTLAMLLADEAANGLARRMPELSAHVVITRTQAAVLAMVLALPLVCALVWPEAMWRAVIWFTSLSFLAGIVFRAVVSGVGFRVAPKIEAAVGDALPVYTILVPLYREANVLPKLAAALTALDYPMELLDIKIVVEEDDDETFVAAKHLAAPFEVVRVPQGFPRTKPRACNYALNFARGAFTVIYDAEDEPEPDQLRKAVAAFAARPADVACLQAKLNFFNAQECWLARLFAIEYALWFDVMLPGLQRMGVPMPLGGTSNHFRTAALRQLGGWDAWNVTEDADLGIRIAQLGGRVEMLDSTTFEEAPTRFGVWKRQRSRWMKGYMQTWLVHTRRPLALIERAGVGGFVAFHLFIGGAVLAALATPLLWLVFAMSIVLTRHQMAAAVSLSSLVTGNVLLTALAMAGPVRRGWHDLSPYGLSMMFYWTLIAVAAWRGLKELVLRPWHWDKTEHGLSRWTR